MDLFIICCLPTWDCKLRDSRDSYHLFYHQEGLAYRRHSVHRGLVAWRGKEWAHSKIRLFIDLCSLYFSSLLGPCLLYCCIWPGTWMLTSEMPRWLSKLWLEIRAKPRFIACFSSHLNSVTLISIDNLLNILCGWTMGPTSSNCMEWYTNSNYRKLRLPAIFRTQGVLLWFWLIRKTTRRTRCIKFYYPYFIHKQIKAQRLSYKTVKKKNKKWTYMLVVKSSLVRFPYTTAIF